jgi:hypothetical protein
MCVAGDESVQGPLVAPRPGCEQPGPPAKVLIDLLTLPAGSTLRTHATQGGPGCSSTRAAQPHEVKARSAQEPLVAPRPRLRATGATRG